MKKKITFSIITPVLNSDRFIKRTLLSIKHQSFQNFEHIIIDGGSTDKTLKIIKKYKNKKTKILVKKDRNLWEAINRGIKISKGKYICILNSDDYFYKNALRIINNYFIKNKNLSYIFGAVRKNNRILYRLEKEKIYYKFNVYPSHSVSFFIKKDIQKKLGYYNTNLDICSDYDFFFKLFNKKNIYGSHTKKKEVIGFFRPGGLSEKISLIKRLYYEFKIRYQNKQNVLFLILLLNLTLLNIIKNIVIKFFLKSSKNT
jgi:glycosyltransferase involved in cell wall biosynthesis